MELKMKIEGEEIIGVHLEGMRQDSRSTKTNKKKINIISGCLEIEKRITCICFAFVTNI